MPAWLRRDTKEFIPSTSPADMAARFGEVFTDANGKAVGNANTILNPDLSDVVGWADKYWTITGDTVALMKKPDRDDVDANQVIGQRDDVVAEMDQTEGLIRALALVLLEEINTLRTREGLQPRTIQQLRTAIRNKLGS